jgi:hypothetical protein
MTLTWIRTWIGRYRTWRAARFTALVRRDLQLSPAWRRLFLRHEGSR